MKKSLFKNKGYFERKNLIFKLKAKPLQKSIIRQAEYDWSENYWPSFFIPKNFNTFYEQLQFFIRNDFLGYYSVEREYIAWNHFEKFSSKPLQFFFNRQPKLE